MHILKKNFGGKQTLSATLGAPGGKAVPYLFPAFAWGHTIYSIFCNDPIVRAKQGGVYFAMKEIIRRLLIVVQIISFILSSIFSVLGIYGEIMRPAKLEKLLKALYIPITYDQFLIFGYVCVGIMIIIYIVRTKFF